MMRIIFSSLTTGALTLAPLAMAQPAPAQPPLLRDQAPRVVNGNLLPDDDVPVAAFGLPEIVEPTSEPQWLIPGAAGGSLWIAQGPGPTQFGQVENLVPNNEVCGAVHVVLAHPLDPNTAYLGGVNGGVWVTDNARAVHPNWTPLTDLESSLSIGALDFDPTDPTFQTLIAGIGRFSSFGRDGGSRDGLLRTTDGGATWTAIDGGGQLNGMNISGVAARGATLVISVDFANNFIFNNIGIFRSTNGGLNFSQISQGNGAATGLPGGLCFDLAAESGSLTTLYTPIVFADSLGGQNGIYKSFDTGATWTKVSDPNMDAQLISGTTSNVEIDSPAPGVVYVAILNNGQLRQGGAYYTTNGGATWTKMDTPLTNETGGTVGTNPRNKPDAGIPGGQGSIHFSILGDRNNPGLVYVGGDRQPAGFNDQFGFPNAIGANDYSGRLFRGDTMLPPGSQWVHLTHSNSLGAPGGGTASSSAPHADSREMDMDAAGEIIEGDDGGIYRRINPQSNAGDWVSMIGDLQVTEFHDIAYDNVSNIVIGGAQDTGTPEQIVSGGLMWDSVSTADGGDVAIDEVSVPGMSLRYSSFQFLQAFRKRTVDAANNVINVAFPSLIVAGSGGQNLFQLDGNRQFAQPIALNKVNPSRGLIGTANLYESFDQFDNLTDVSGFQNAFINAMAYGGFSGGAPNPDVIYFAINPGSPTIKRRTTAGGGFTTLGSYPGSSTVRGIVLDPDEWNSVYTVDSSQVFQSLNAGTNWTNITGNLTGAGTLRCIEYMRHVTGDALLVGTDKGVFSMPISMPGVWTEVGDNLANAPVYDMEYDEVDDVVVVGTLGRGAWLAQGPCVRFGCAPCAADLNGDGATDSTDLSILLGNFGTTGGAIFAQGDVDGDGDVDSTDLSLLLTEFGSTCLPD